MAKYSSVFNVAVKREENGALTFAHVLVTLDPDVIASLLGPKASKTKSGKATAMFGAVTVELVKE